MPNGGHVNGLIAHAYIWQRNLVDFLVSGMPDLLGMGDGFSGFEKVIHGFASGAPLGSKRRPKALLTHGRF